MTNPSDREVAVFGTARRLPVAERACYLDEACGGDKAFRKRVEELLQSGEEAGAFLESMASGAGGTVRIPVIPTEKPDRIGRYKLLQQIGEGGCGVVYMAEQEEPVHRRVALKVIKLGMDTKSVIARFEAERQALALMDHPNIAKVLDAGATDTGRPYFVMELVRGIKITDYCDENKISMEERLKLFIQVCHAIQHAHQKGVIHRDIKPSNILVTVNDGVPVPKVIDFGIAKATQGRLAANPPLSRFLPAKYPRSQFKTRLRKCEASSIRQTDGQRFQKKLMKTLSLFEASAPAPVRPSSVSKAVADRMAKLGEFRILTLRETPAFGKAEQPEHSADYWRTNIDTDPRHNPDVETLVCLVLNTRRDILDHFLVASGLLDTILCHPREVFCPAIVANASAIIVMHNHPSGDASRAKLTLKSRGI